MKRRQSDRRNARGRGRRSPSRLRIEALENRQLLATITVNTTADNDVRDALLSLREALLVANGTLAVSSLSAEEQALVSGAVGDPDEVVFDLGPPADAREIRLLSALPTVAGAGAVRITGPVNATGQPTLTIRPDTPAATTDGLTFEAGGSAVQNLILNGFSGAAITFRSTASGEGNGNLVTNSYIGTNTAGAAGLGNGVGIRIASSSDNTIGGVSAAVRNVISGNQVGIEIESSSAVAGSGNLIRGNYIGTTPDAASARGNTVAGIRIRGSANNIIGGDGATFRNVISGNAVGVLLDGSGSSVPTTGNQVVGNFIGTDVTGLAAIPNTTGVLSRQAVTLVGGLLAGQRNYISGNADAGVLVEGVGSAGTLIRGNLIGLATDDASPLGNGVNGIRIDGALNVQVGGSAFGSTNVVVASGGDGIRITAPAAADALHVVAGNFVGTNPAGATNLGNLGNGIAIVNSRRVLVGGPDEPSGNIIGGNALSGLAIAGGGANEVANNRIGLNGVGVALANQAHGIDIADSAANLIGGSPALRNVISGNAMAGIRVVGNSPGTLIQSNFIGTNLAGNAAQGNGRGIEIGSSGAIIGGLTPGAGNLISGNAGFGILLTDALGGTPDLNTIQANRIGLAAAGSDAVPNVGQGIRIVGGQLNVIGGLAVGEGNLIANNAKGVVIVNGTRPSIGNRLLGNAVGPNVGIGIDLGDDGPTAIGSDNPAGPNALQSKPAVLSAIIGEATTRIVYSLNAPSPAGYRVEFFLSGTAQGFEGRQFLAATTLGAGASGEQTFDLPFRLGLGQFVTATVTNLDTFNTSEYSAAATVDDLSDLAIAIDPLPTGLLIGSQFTYTIRVTNLGLSPASNIVIDTAIDAAIGEILSAQSSLGTATFDASAGTAQATIAALNVNSTVTLVIQVLLRDVGTLTIAGSVAAETEDPVPGNNTLPGGLAVPVAPAIDLTLVAVANPPIAPTGTTSTFTFTIGNDGPSDATGVVFTTSALDALGEFVAAGSTPGLEFLGDRTFRFARPTPLAPGAIETVTIVIRGLGPGTIQLAGAVAGLEAEPDQSDNAATAAVTVSPAADIRVSTVLESAQAVITRRMVILVTVTNTGPADAINLETRTTLPEGLEFIANDPADPGPTSDAVVTVAGNELQALLANLPAGGTWTFRIVVRPTATGPLEVPTVLTSGTFDPVPGNNVASLTTQAGATVNVLPLADLTPSLIARPEPVTAGQVLTYTVVVNNQGPSIATNAVVVVALPAGVLFEGVQPSQGVGVFDAATNSVLVNLGNVGVGAVPTVQIFVRPQVAGRIVATAAVSSEAVDDIGTNVVSTPVDVLPSADLAVTTVVASQPLLGQPLTFTVTVVNNGPSPADNTLLVNALPAGLAPVGAPVASQGVVEQPAGFIVAQFGRLEPGAQATLTFVLVPTALGTIVNGAAVQSSASDLVPGNNASTTALQVAPAANLALTSTALPATVRRGTNQAVTLTIVNNGPAPAENVRLEGVLPGNLEFVSGSASQGQVARVNGSIVANIGTIPVGGQVTINLVLLPTLAGAFAIGFAATATTADPSAADNVVVVSSNAEGAVGVLQLSEASYTVDEGAGVATITVVRVGGDAGAVTVDYAVTPSSAEAGVDFTPVSGTLRFEDGETSKSFTVPIIDNQIPQGNRLAVVTLSNPGLGAGLGDRNQVGLVIVDNDAALLPGPQVVSIARTGRGNRATVQVIFSEPMDPGTASNPANYRLVGAGRDGRLGTGDDQLIALASVTYDPATRTATLRPAPRANIDPALQLTINGDTDGAPLSAGSGTRLDGNGDGRQGGNFVGQIQPLTTVFDPRFYEIYRRFLRERRSAALARLRPLRAR